MFSLYVAHLLSYARRGMSVGLPLGINDLKSGMDSTTISEVKVSIITCLMAVENSRRYSFEVSGNPFVKEWHSHKKSFSSNYPEDSPSFQSRNLCVSCNFRGSASQLQQHECLNAPMKCPLGCGASVPSHLMADHKVVCNHCEVTCKFPGCTVKYMAKDEIDHYNNCLSEHLESVRSMTDEGHEFLKKEVQQLKIELKKAKQELQNERELHQFEIGVMGENSRQQQLRISDLERIVRALEEKVCKLESSKSLKEQPQLQSFYMDNFTEWTTRNEPWRSVELKTTDGYKFFFEVFADEPSSDRGIPFEMKLFAARGNHDEELVWPVKLFFTLTLVNYKGGMDKKIMECISWERPTQDYEYVDFFPPSASSDHPGSFIEVSKLPFFLHKDRLHFKLFVTK